MNVVTFKDPPAQDAQVPDMRRMLDVQRAAFLAEGPPDARERALRIDRLLALLLENAHALAEAMSQDFGHRPHELSLATDVFGIVPSIKHTRKHFRRWMRPERVSAGLLGWGGGRAWIQRQPLGVVGIVSPWNFPVALALQPLAEAFAAGNRALIKLSELTPRTSALLQGLFSRSFDPAVAAAITGGAEAGAAFCRLPFDHIFFTGAPEIGRHVQRAAADNLAPTTLELGGKCPVIVTPGADLQSAAAKIAFGKTLNAGQICLSPDYVFVKRGSEEAFVEAMRQAIAKLFPTLLNNADYTSLVARRHHARIQAYLDEARDQGARVIEINPAGEDFAQQPHFKMPPALVLGATPRMKLLKEEIFGPVLPVLVYDHLDEAIAYINTGPRPLALYYFGPFDADCKRCLDRTWSGGAVVNDVIVHAMVEDLPFGGVGGSGMGSYHGRHGFNTFSHARGVVRAGLLSPRALMSPPYKRLRPIFDWVLKREIRAVRRRLKGQ
jgi:coniferyl-aldehyde dehydrogenase